MTIMAYLWATTLSKFVIPFQTVETSSCLKQYILQGLNILHYITWGRVMLSFTVNTLHADTLCDKCTSCRGFVLDEMCDLT